MRVLVAPDSFGGTLSAGEASVAIARGWARAAPGDTLDLVGLSDGGPGFLDALATSLGGDRLAVAAEDPLGRAARAEVLRHGDTAYVESAQACGLQLVAPGERNPLVASSAGVGDLIRAAVATGARKVVIGLGGSATNDGGAGMLARLGLVLVGGGRRIGPDPGSVIGLDRVEQPAGWRDHLPAELVAAADVDNPLLGPAGATATFGPQKGASADGLAQLEAALGRLAAVIGRDLPGCARLERTPGAGAAGGLGYGILVLGGRLERGIELVSGAVGLVQRVAAADLVVTGEGSLDGQSLRGKVVSGVARVAREAGLPCLALAGQVSLSGPELEAAGITACWSLVAEAGSLEASLASARPVLEAVAEKAARAAPRRRPTRRRPRRRGTFGSTGGPGVSAE